MSSCISQHSTLRMSALKMRNRAGVQALELFSHIFLILEHAGVPMTHCYEEHRKNTLDE